MTRAWAHQHHSPLRPRLRQLFQNGELGLVSLMLAISVIWDLQKSLYSSYTIALGSVFLAMAGIMAGFVWVFGCFRRCTGTPLSPRRFSREFRHLGVLLLSLS